MMEAASQGWTTDPQSNARFTDIASGRLQRLVQHNSVNTVVNLLGYFMGTALPKARDVSAEAFLPSEGERHLGRLFFASRKSARQKRRRYHGAAGTQQCLLDDALQLPNISRPRVLPQNLHRLGATDTNSFSSDLANVLKK